MRQLDNITVEYNYALSLYCRRSQHYNSQAVNSSHSHSYKVANIINSFQLIQLQFSFQLNHDYSLPCSLAQAILYVALHTVVSVVVHQGSHLRHRSLQAKCLASITTLYYLFTQLVTVIMDNIRGDLYM